jgi:hypothetical protein
MPLITSPTDRLPVVFTAQSKIFFYCRDAVCEFVFSRGAVPINPFRVFEYFLGDRVERDLVRQGNNNLIHIVDELWVFGDVIADGVLAEICLANELQKPTRFFTIHNKADQIREITPLELRFEPEVRKRWSLDRQELIDVILGRRRDPNDPQLSMFDDGQKP